MLAEVEELRVEDELLRRLREQGLPAVAGCRDARRPVHVHAHVVALVGERRFAGVDADTYANRACP